ncbi:FAD:protein FMN transferase [Enterococcus sp. DIV0800]|uniref:FAD:protein FMN transferase n=1 Tax=unclassified Enterococcus TaxID=2608891 RepID=UPI003D2FF5AC
MVASRQIRAMGTVIDITLSDDASEELITLAETRVQQYEHRFSANDATSELMQINSNAGIKAVTVKPELFDLIQLGYSHSLNKDDYLNIAIGPLIQTWRIGFENARVPAQAEIRYQLQLIDPQQIVLNPDKCSVFLPKKGMKIDLGALAKGYIADLLVAELQQVGATAGLVNLGGNVLTFGISNHQDGLWRIGIRDPNGTESDLARVLKVGTKSVVTSGIYERTLQVSGQTYHHIFDSTTGYPIATNLASLTIISNDSVSGEIWTTRLFGYSAPEILRRVSNLPGIEAVILLKDGTEYLSAGMSAYI